MSNTYQTIQNGISSAVPIAFVGGENLIHGEAQAKAIGFLVDFGATAPPSLPITYAFDPTKYFQNRTVLSLQTVFIDNSTNNAPIIVTSLGFIGQVISIPAGSQGIFPIFCPAGSGGKFLITSPSGTGLANIAFLNVYFQAAQWSSNVATYGPGVALPVSDAALEALIVAGRFNVRTLAGQLTAVDRSGTIAAANTQQVLAAANAARQGLELQNIDTGNLEGLFYNPTGLAVIGTPGTFELAQGSAVGYPGGSVKIISSNAVSIIAATAGHKFSAIEY